jgi:hypothetical protein
MRPPHPRPAGAPRWNYTLTSTSAEAAREAALWSAGGGGAAGQDGILEGFQDWLIGRWGVVVV